MMEEYTSSVPDVERLYNTVMGMKIILFQFLFDVIFVYEPQTSCEVEENEKLLREM